MDLPASERQESAREVAERAASLVGAFGRHDPAAYFAHFSPDASFIFYTEEEVLRSREQYEALWRRWEETEGFRVRGCRSENAAVRLVGGSAAAVFTHDVTTMIETRLSTETRRERETIVFERSGDGWLAVHEHLSPGVAPAGDAAAEPQPST